MNSPRSPSVSGGFPPSLCRDGANPLAEHRLRGADLVIRLREPMESPAEPRWAGAP